MSGYILAWGPWKAKDEETMQNLDEINTKMNGVELFLSISKGFVYL